MAAELFGLVTGAEVPSLPSIYLQVSKVVGHPRSTAEDIAKVIRDDAGLASRLLRLTNSALFAFPSKISTVSRAVIVVGTQELCDLAFATAVLGVFCQANEALSAALAGGPAVRDPADPALRALLARVTSRVFAYAFPAREGSGF